MTRQGNTRLQQGYTSNLPWFTLVSMRLIYIQRGIQYTSNLRHIQGIIIKKRKIIMLDALLIELTPSSFQYKQFNKQREHSQFSSKILGKVEYQIM